MSDGKPSISTIPAQYKRFVKNIKGNDYMAVDGRAAWLIDEHREKGKQVDISFENEYVRAVKEIMAAGVASANKEAAIEAIKAIPEQLKNIMRAVVVSEEYGRFEGSAKIGWAGSGVDSTNPWENAETSALGRALGFMGYGLLGAGIASYEEVKTALAEQEKLEGPKVASPAPAPKPAPAAPPAPAPRPPQNPELFAQPAKTADNANPNGEAAPDPNNPAPVDRDSASDPAFQQTEGPCADCGGEMAKTMQSYINNNRKKGKTLRWSHREVPGGEKGQLCKKAAS